VDAQKEGSCALNPRAVLQERYATADFELYFRFLDDCCGTRPDSGRTHKHHICPRAQFPEYMKAEWNLITLTVEDHKQAHRLLAVAVPDVFGTPAAWIALAAEGGRIGGRICKDKRKGVFAPGAAARGGLIAGCTSQQTHKKNGTGCYSREMQAEGGRIGGRSKSLAKKVSAVRAIHIRWHVNRSIVNPTCSLCAS
jgi:hypothetical protein